MSEVMHLADGAMPSLRRRLPYQAFHRGFEPDNGEAFSIARDGDRSG